jgi:hypothetical protein
MGYAAGRGPPARRARTEGAVAAVAGLRPLAAAPAGAEVLVTAGP